ncbi:MAG: GlsB/YeaQ/YmgE family stress response membrane protein [Saprospiraceae bacterium]|nr:GlsB/YeaQ/YmgE family stress response membrane protein [Saprospiraceae bacterium]
MGDWIWTLIISGVAGFLGSLLFKGRGSGIIVNIILGLLGGSLGRWIFEKLGFSGSWTFLSAVVGAFLVCWIVSLFSKK